MPETINLDLETALDLCKRAARACGASEYAAESLAAATVAAEARGQTTVGLAHFLDYIDAMRAGRIDGSATPVLTRPAAAVIVSNACGGIAHSGFDLAFEELVMTAERFGVALFSQHNAYTCGALGYFAERLAQRNLIALAVANSSAHLAAGGAKRPIYGTNPLAFAAPQQHGPALLIDQASSATAFVNVRAAAEAGRPLPDGWAIDQAGEPTNDPSAVLTGALLAFGGARGGNIALMVEVLSALSGANWSLDAPSFRDGAQSPGVGMLIVALAPDLIDPSFIQRWSSQLRRLRDEHHVFIPGVGKANALQQAVTGGLNADAAVVRRILAVCAAQTDPSWNFVDRI